MADVRSKNLYELLGNDPELNPNREPEPPTKAIDRPTARHGKRDAPKEPVTQAAPQANNRRGGRGPGGNEAAFRDRNAGRTNNRDKPTEDGPSQRRFPRGERRGNDRQSRASHTDTKKQVNQGWGAQSGNQEWDDERAAENIAKAEETEPQTPGEKTEEPADKAKSYADYLAEKAAQGDLSAKPVRAPNEGSQGDKKWAGAKELKHNEEEDNYIKGSTEKTKREKQRKEKNFLDVDLRYVEPAAPRGGGGPRGGRGGRGGGRGGPSGGRGRGGGGGGAPRGERGGAPISVDEKNFPSLGAK